MTDLAFGLAAHGGKMALIPWKWAKNPANPPTDEKAPMPIDAPHVPVHNPMGMATYAPPPSPPPVSAAKAAVPAMPPPLRWALLRIGGCLTTLIAERQTTPEQVAKDTGIDVDTVYQLLTGREADVGVGTLSVLSSHLGATFIPHIDMPKTPPASSAS